MAEAAIGRAATDKYSETYDADTYFDDDTSFAASLRDAFKYGRTTAATCDWNIGRMPNPEHGCDGKGVYHDPAAHGERIGWQLCERKAGQLPRLVNLGFVFHGPREV